METYAFQVLVITVCAVVLFAGLYLRSKGVSVATVIESVQTTLNPEHKLLTAAERKAKAKAHRNWRNIGWAERRLVYFYTICYGRTKHSAFKFLFKMTKDTDSANVNRALSVLEQLAMGKGDMRYSERAMEAIKSVSPKRALAVQVAKNREILPEISRYVQPRIHRSEQAPQGIPQAA